MKIIFLGVGEACDERYLNTSLLIYSNKKTILLDCGFTITHQFFKYEKDEDALDIVWISHFHGDHFLEFLFCSSDSGNREEISPFILLVQRDWRRLLELP